MEALIWQSIILLALLSEFVFDFRENNTFVAHENSGLKEYQMHGIKSGY